MSGSGVEDGFEPLGQPRRGNEDDFLEEGPLGGSGQHATCCGECSKGSRGWRFVD